MGASKEELVQGLLEGLLGQSDEELTLDPIRRPSHERLGRSARPSRRNRMEDCSPVVPRFRTTTFRKIPPRVRD